MEKYIFFGFMVLCGIICIVTPKSVSELLFELSWFSEKQSTTRTLVIRLMGVTIIALALIMFFG